MDRVWHLMCLVQNVAVEQLEELATRTLAVPWFDNNSANTSQLKRIASSLFLSVTGVAECATIRISAWVLND
jgi:hypothetical protein